MLFQNKRVLNVKILNIGPNELPKSCFKKIILWFIQKILILGPSIKLSINKTVSQAINSLIVRFESTQIFIRDCVRTNHVDN